MRTGGPSRRREGPPNQRTTAVGYFGGGGTRQVTLALLPDESTAVRTASADRVHARHAGRDRRRAVAPALLRGGGDALALRIRTIGGLDVVDADPGRQNARRYP